MAGRLHTLLAERQRVVAGLQWRDTPGDDAAAVKEQIRSAADAFRSRHGVVIDAARSEVGLVPETAPREARSGVSGAAWLAHAIQEPVLYVEALANGSYWIVHTESGYVDPRSDEVVGEDEASSLVDGLLDTSHGSGNAMRVVLAGARKPASVMLDRISDPEFKTFAELVRGVSPPSSARIRQLVGVTPGAIAAVVGLFVLLGAAYAGYLVYAKWEQQREFEQRRAALAAQEAEAARLRTEAELRMKLAVDAAAAQDTATAPPNDVLRTCVNRLESLGSRVGGWRVVSAECDPNGQTLTAIVTSPTGSPEIGTAFSLMDTAAERNIKAAINPANGRATLTVPLTPPESRKPLKPSELPPYLETLRSVLSRMQLAKVAIQALNFSMTEPAPRSVVYLDPEMEKSNDPARFKQVPSEKTYLKSALRVDGVGRWPIDALSFNYPFLTLTKFQLTPSSSGLAWHLEAEYVTSH